MGLSYGTCRRICAGTRTSILHASTQYCGPVASSICSRCLLCGSCFAAHRCAVSSPTTCSCAQNLPRCIATSGHDSGACYISCIRARRGLLGVARAEPEPAGAAISDTTVFCCSFLFASIYHKIGSPFFIDVFNHDFLHSLCFLSRSADSAPATASTPIDHPGSSAQLCLLLISVLNMIMSSHENLLFIIIIMIISTRLITLCADSQAMHALLPLSRCSCLLRFAQVARVSRRCARLAARLDKAICFTTFAMEFLLFIFAVRTLLQT